MLLFTLFYVTAVFLVAGRVQEANTTELLVRGTVPCDPISNHSVTWFLGNTCKRPPTATCLFYTRGLNRTARTFSKSGGNDMTTIWDMWSPTLYVKKQLTSNPLRCIMRSITDRGTYFKHMSQAMAVTCDLFATVMTKESDDPPVNGIWGITEFPTLQRSDNQGKVNTIDKSNEDASKVAEYWSRYSARLFKGRSTKLQGRAEDGSGVDGAGDYASGTCGIDDDDVAGDIDEGTEYEVIW